VTDEELKQLIQESAAETQRVIGTRIDGVRRELGIQIEENTRKIELVAEGVSNLNEKIDRVEARLDAKIDETAAVTQGMIKFGYDRLDRRVTALEEKR